MLDFSHLPTSTKADVQVFNATATSTGVWQYVAWHKPRGVSMLHILAIGAGGNGGNGAVGAALAAAGGAGGGSGGQTSLVIPAALLPDILYCRVGVALTGFAMLSQVVIDPSAQSATTVIVANGGAAGGNASGATAGAATAGGSVASIATMSLAGLGFYTLLAGQAGIVGHQTLAPPALTLPVTGLLITGGTGGAGVPGVATGGSGGSFTVTGAFPPHPGGIGATSTTTPGGNGSNGFDRVINGLSYSYGGTGGGSTGNAPTGAGLVAGNGGNGGIGCGGGGGGGGFTGSTQGLGGRGGPGQIIITAW